MLRYLAGLIIGILMGAEIVVYVLQPIILKQEKELISLQKRHIELQEKTLKHQHTYRADLIEQHMRSDKILSSLGIVNKFDWYN